MVKFISGIFGPELISDSPGHKYFPESFDAIPVPEHKQLGFDRDRPCFPPNRQMQP